MPNPKAFMNWSGGKDAALCLYRGLQNSQYRVSSLLTTINRHYGRVSQHGVRRELLERQAQSIGLPLKTVEMPRCPSMETYNRLMEEALRFYREQDITTAIFGDILLEDLRTYREEQLEKAGFTGVFPLWDQPTDELLRAFIGAGFKAVVVCVDEEHLDKAWAGRELDESFLKDLPAEVDPCGENGEFHTFVYDGPIFQRPVAFERGERIRRTYEPPERDDADFTCGSQDPQRLQEKGFWYCDLWPAHTPSASEVAQTKDTTSAQS